MPQSVEVSCAVCPYVTDINFVRGVTDATLLPLSQLKHLRVLNVGNDDDVLVSFEGGVLPLLQVVGRSLQELSLFEVNDLDLGAIGACCPELKKFSCLIAGFPSATFPVNAHPELLQVKQAVFTHLEQVRVLLHTAENTFPSQFVRLLTVHAKNLSVLHLAYIQTLTDDLFQEILHSNPMERLERLVLESCHHISGEAIHQLLHMKNNLQALVLKDCRDITLRDFTAYKRFVADNNYDTCVEWV
jgi:hypothetical protein